MAWSDARVKLNPKLLFSRLCQFLRMVVTNMTIEPGVFLLAFSGNMDDISVNQMLIYKSCKVDFEFNSTVCDNLVTDFKDQNELVQDKIAQFNVYVTMVSNVFPVFFAFYLGAWCDVFGRKLCIFLFFGAKIIGNVVVIVVAYYLDTAKEWYFVSLIPTALVGGYGALMMSLNAFIADISEPDQRAFRMAMLHTFGSLARPMAPPLGAYLLKQGGYVCVTSASLAFVIAGLVYMYIVLKTYKWEVERKKNRNAFSLYHIRDAIVTTLKRRPGPNRKYLLILMTCMVFIIVPFFGEMNISYIYVRTRYEWEVEEYSTYNSIVSSAGILAQVTMIPLLTYFNIRNSLVLMFVILSVFMRHIVKAFAFKGWIYYVADFVDLIGTYSMSLIRAMVTCCIPMHEFGKIYAVLTAFENLIPIGVSQAYAEIWKITSDTFPGTVFLFSAVITLIPLSLSAFVFFSLRGKRLSDVTVADKDQKDLDVKNDPYMRYMPPPSYQEAMISHI